MSVALYDSFLYGSLFSDPDTVKLFSDSERVQAMLSVESALAEVQGDLRIIPSQAADEIVCATRTLKPDFDALQSGTEQAGFPIIALTSQLKSAVSQETAHYIHWGATTQDIMDTALILQLKEGLTLFERSLDRVIEHLGNLADLHRNTLMAGRTHSQQALPITFGYKVAGWLAPLLRHRMRLTEMRPRLCVVQFGGAAGTLAALGEQGMEVMEHLAKKLTLELPLVPWHSQRDAFAELANWLSLITGSLGKLAQDVILLSQSEINEIRESSHSDRGGSSTMPQKSNPILSEMIVACARMNATLLSNMHHALIAEQERATHGWQLEWLTLPQMFSCTGAALNHANKVAESLVINDQQMQFNLDRANGLLLAEAATFALSEFLPRSEAQRLVKSACLETAENGRHLMDILAEQSKINEIDWQAMKNPAQYLGMCSVFVDRVLDSLSKSRPNKCKGSETES
ncbi:MAG: 3-carboxy-cis,cis-muconate cycloisomerase [SAR324 cluster bacterium]|nr:3-carboxy-cis,cis-muconate cycloisomerase [SAR324 cluster bacterium]